MDISATAIFVACAGALWTIVMAIIGFFILRYFRIQDDEIGAIKRDKVDKNDFNNLIKWKDYIDTAKANRDKEISDMSRSTDAKLHAIELTLNSSAGLDQKFVLQLETMADEMGEMRAESKENFAELRNDIKSIQRTSRHTINKED